eukprot:jgi/Astpho2/9313/e_gw1.00142.50.1_t
MQPSPGVESCSVMEHHKALQGLSNGSKLPYSRTLRVVQHKVTKFPKVETSQARHAPGYIRGELGGMFTS